MIDWTPNPIALQLGPISLYWYGICYAIGLAGAYVVMTRMARRFHQNATIIGNSLIVVAIAALAGGRLYHVIDQWQNLYAADPIKIFLPPYAGLGIFGGFITGLIAVIALTRYYKVSFWRWADIVAPGVFVMQAAGRIGNFFNQELYGPPTNLPWGIAIDCAHRVVEYPCTTFPQATTHFHPLFLYESLSAVIAASVLIWLSSRPRPWLRVGDLDRHPVHLARRRPVPARVPSHRQLADRRHPDGPAVRGGVRADRDRDPRLPPPSGCAAARPGAGQPGGRGRDDRRRRVRGRRRRGPRGPQPTTTTSTSSTTSTRRTRPAQAHLTDQPANRSGRAPDSGRRRWPPLAAARGKASSGSGGQPEARASLLYRSLRLVARFVLFGVFRFRIETSGQEHLPGRGGYLLIAAAHRGWMDPVRGDARACPSSRAAGSSAAGRRRSHRAGGSA